MATTRHFAYNIGSPFIGATQVGNLAIGIPSAGFESTGLEWWNGPDEELGYVIAVPVSNGTANICPGFNFGKYHLTS